LQNGRIRREQIFVAKNPPASEMAVINIFAANQLQRFAAIKKKESKFPCESKLVNSGAKLFADHTIFPPDHPLSA
jgi:hypothetical protein